MRGGAGRAGGALVCGIVVLVVASSAYGPSTPSATSTRDAVPGTCHVAEDPNELSAAISDTAPAVPCDRPHQTETLWTGRVTGPLDAEERRPNPELINAMLGRACDDYWRVRSYLGADAHDSHWGVTTLLKVPTPAEWAEGDRTFRCEATGPPKGTDGPSLTGTLRGVLRRSDSAAYRLCRSGPAMVTCDRPHDREAMSPDVGLDRPIWPGDQVLHALARPACRALGETYIAASLADRPDVSVVAEVPGREQWDSGTRHARCWLVSSTLSPRTGTLRGGLR